MLNYKIFNLQNGPFYCLQHFDLTSAFRFRAQFSSFGVENYRKYSRTLGLPQ